LAAFAEIVLQDNTLLALLFYGVLSFNACLYPMDRMLTSVRRPLSDCS